MTNTNSDDQITTQGSAAGGVARRDFVKVAAAVGATSSIAGLAMPVWGATPAGDRLKVGLVGCGGRGTGAANQAINADPGVMLWAMGDVYEDRLKNSYNGLKNEHGTRVMVDQERQFVGFDAIDKVLESGVDVVILATPPGFRPDHLEKAVTAKKHVFCEKPMATDMPGLRRVMETAKKAKSQGTQLMSGFCWRYSMPERAMYGEINDGALGEIESIHSTYHTGPLGTLARTPEMTDMDFQLRNWQHQNWLSGDIIAEQAVHSIDKMNWAMGNKPPVNATALAGRGLREGPERGDIFDHFAVIYEWDNGARGFLTCRQVANCSNDNTDWIAGSKGIGYVNGWAPRQSNLKFNDGATTFRFKGETPNMYQTEHNELFKAIRDGELVNDGDWMTQSVAMALLGREAGYSGRTITWEEIMNSQNEIVPADPKFGPRPPIVIPQPGVYKFS
ncbi:MAG: Gfo/Idh/MocA family oxidoreductase [Planctomycetota bacterium]|nr:Gfo/Idh/MocA family oxidoreductase [Planctomycetota bacterium]MDA1025045.1 Gfo/Idh/MocA family oxidoreductase [Planctomycetota bacterium]